jgi:hypothetical protein
LCESALIAGHRFFYIFHGCTLHHPVFSIREDTMTNRRIVFPKKAILIGLLVIACTVYATAAALPAWAGGDLAPLHSDDPSAPASPVKLIFIHHSTGENWLADDNGGLGIALMNNNYFVSDTNYGWGPDFGDGSTIGDHTDIPNWLDWFGSEGTPTYSAALFAESGQHASYSRLERDPGGQNEIIVFKSCFPNSALEGSPDDPPSADGWLSVGHAKYVYNRLLPFFRAHPDKLFVVITAPPLRDASAAANARAFNNWLVNDWLHDYSYPLQNVAVFDFYNVLTTNGGNAGTNDLGRTTGNHHRWYNGAIQHAADGTHNTLAYPTGDDHPGAAGGRKAAAEFLPLLNIFYHRWKDSLSLSPGVGGCAMYPADNVWNTPVDDLPVAAQSTDWIDSIGRTTGFHMDFGSGTWDGGPIGIPYNLAEAGAPRVSVTFDYADESDAGPYPIPSGALIEYGSDHHILVVDRSTCTLYELYDARYSGGAWHAGSGAIWDLNSNQLRPSGWTSADAAGLPILPGLVRYDEIAAGAIRHALRFTAASTRDTFIWPARHYASDDSSAALPPMGARFRLKASFDISGYPAPLQVILQAMKIYGIILADNGSSWYVSGAPDERWDNDMLHQLDDLTGDDFEAVDSSSLMVDANSGEAQTASLPAAIGKSAPVKERRRS